MQAFLAVGLLSHSEAAEPPGPTAPSLIPAFRGSIAYVAHPDDNPSRTIEGTLAVAQSGWSLDERSTSGDLHFSDAQSWIVSSGQRIYIDDPFAAQGLANAWALLLGRSVGATIGADPSGHSWTVGKDLRIYIDPANSRVAGLVDLAADSSASYSFDQWQQFEGISLPSTIVRMDGGIPETTYRVDSYTVNWAQTAQSVPATRWESGSAIASSPAAVVAHLSDTERAWRSFGLLCLTMLGALALAAWTRRDALTGKLCRRLASDPRGWRDVGTNVFVSPEGILWYDGREYRVGAGFFNRRVIVQSSLLFVRVSAAGTGMPVVIARKFPRFMPPGTAHRSPGFTLIEALAATALFASVIVAAVFPTLIVLAHADRVAALHEAATQVAENALVDEEAALEYGSSSITDTQATSRVDGLDLTVTVAPSNVSAMQLVTASVSDPSGAPLAKIATMVGPPVPAPQAQTGPPSPP